MSTFRCPNCGSPATVTGIQWQCGWCGNFGSVKSAPAKITLRLKVTFDGPDQEVSSREDSAEMDRLLKEFPEAFCDWPEEKRTDGYIEDLLQDTYPNQPELAIRMWKMILDDAGEELQASGTAEFLLDEYMESVWKEGLDFPESLEPILDELYDPRFEHQVFQSAYIGEPHEAILFACKELHRDAQAEELFALIEPYLQRGTAYDKKFRKIMEELRKASAPPEKDNVPPKTAETEKVLADDGTVYRYCTVRIEGSTRAYSYLTGQLPVKVDDWVEVPFGTKNVPCRGQVTSVFDCTRLTAPWPPEKTKAVLRVDVPDGAGPPSTTGS